MVFLRDLDRTDICGYLGNNFFQILAGYSLAQRNNVSVTIPDTWEYTEIFKYPFFNVMSKKLIEENIKFEYSEPYFHYKEIPYQYGINLNGYFQSPKYFEGVNVKEILKPKDEITNQILNTVNKQLDKTYDEIFAYHRITSCHLRLSDYINFSNIFVNLQLTNYYVNAIEKLIDYTDYFLIFSNDIEYCKEYFKNYTYKNKIIFCESEQEKPLGNKSSVIDLYLMSMANNFIIANSTFSFWGAMLGDSLKKKVIAPKNWFVNNFHDSKDLIPESWIKL